jgi:phosphoribosylaminoimidazole-succinocarboxamide synthase
MSDDFVGSVSDRYIELFETLTGEEFDKSDYWGITKRIEESVLEYLKVS